MAYARSNPHRFTTTRAGKSEIDEEFNTQTGWINDTSRRLDTIETSGISGADNPANAGKVPVTDGYHISWKKVDLSYLTPQSMNDTILQDRSITNRVMGVHSVGSDQLIDGCISEQKVPHNSLPGTKIRDGTTSLQKLSPSSSVSVMAGSSDGNSWVECSLNPWEIATNVSVHPRPYGQSLSTIWDNTPGTFDGIKIAENSIPKNRLQTLDSTVFAPNTLSGSVISDDSLPTSKLSGFGVPFAAGFVLDSGEIMSGFNLQRVSMRIDRSTPPAPANNDIFNFPTPPAPPETVNVVYTIFFDRPARSINYMVIATARADNPHFTVCVKNSTLTTTQFEAVVCDTNGQSNTSRFSFVVYQT